MLTIATVSYHSEAYLHLNYNIMSKRCSNFKWLVVDNSDTLKDDRFVKLPGVKMPPETGNKVNKHSHHHAIGMNQTLPYIDTEYVLFLDPDFFILANVDGILHHMKDKQLDFFGASYFPGKNIKPIMDFPVVFCMMVNTNKVDIKSFDFIPPKIDNSNLWHDTGCNIYEKYRPIAKYEIFDIGEPKSKPECCEFYRWGGHISAIHCRAKLHLKNEQARERMFDRHKGIVTKYGAL
jgi:hypothetical protein